MNQDIKKLPLGDFVVVNDVSLEEYEQMLKNHDWYWQMSDNRNVADDGWRKEAQIKAKALISMEHTKLYQKYLKQKFPNKY